MRLGKRFRAGLKSLAESRPELLEGVTMLTTTPHPAPFFREERQLQHMPPPPPPRMHMCCCGGGGASPAASGCYWERVALVQARGKGLLNALVVRPELNGTSQDAWALCLALKDKGLLAKTTHQNVVRLPPPPAVPPSPPALMRSEGWCTAASRDAVAFAPRASDPDGAAAVPDGGAARRAARYHRKSLRAQPPPCSRPCVLLVPVPGLLRLLLLRFLLRFQRWFVGAHVSPRVHVPPPGDGPHVAVPPAVGQKMVKTLPHANPNPNPIGVAS